MAIHSEKYKNVSTFILTRPNKIQTVSNTKKNIVNYNALTLLHNVTISLCMQQKGCLPNP